MSEECTIMDMFGNELVVCGEQIQVDQLSETTILLTVFDVDGTMNFYGFVSHVTFSKS